jgi:glucokinase
MQVACFDVGGTNVRAAIVGPGGILESHTEATNAANESALFQQIQKLLSAFSEKYSAIALGCPGPTVGTKMYGSKPLNFHNVVDFSKAFKNDCPVFVANDLNMAIRAQKRACESVNPKWSQNFALVSLSTGIGVGAVIGGEVVNRRIELGHSVVETDPAKAKKCHGHAGCWVAQASGSSMQKDAFPSFSEEILADLRLYNARGLTNVIHAYDPEVIFLMGSLARHQFSKIIPGKEMFEQHSLIKPVPGIDLCEIGDEIGILGAYEYAKEYSCRN